MWHFRKAIMVKKKIMPVVIAVLLVAAVPVRVSAVTINGLGYFVGSTTRYNSMPGVNSITGAYDVRGKINNSNSYTLQTTYSNGGYTIDFEVDGVSSEIQKVANNAKVTNNGVELTVRAETTAEGLDVHLDINNPEGNGEHSYRVAMTADVQLGNNDYAAIYKKEHSGVVITQDDTSSSSDYGAKVYIDFNPVVDTLWIGDYKERLNNKYLDGDVAAYTVADNLDTAVAWSWNGTLADGEATTLTVSYNLVETYKTHAYFYDLDKELVGEKEALVGGAMELLELPDDRDGYIHVWCEDVEDETTCHAGGGSVIIKTENMSFYEAYIVDPDAWTTINYYDLNENKTNEQEELKGTETTLPDLPDDKPGYFHVWCEDKADESTCKNGGETVTVAEDDMNFYESYIVDPDYEKPEPQPIPAPEPDDGGVPSGNDADDNIVEYTVQYETSDGNIHDNTPMNYYGASGQDDAEVAVPGGAESITDDTISKQLEKTDPLGVTMRENLQGMGFGGILQKIWPYIIAIMLSLGIFFIIILWKRRKDDDEEEEEQQQ